MFPWGNTKFLAWSEYLGQLKNPTCASGTVWYVCLSHALNKCYTIPTTQVRHCSWHQTYKGLWFIKRGHTASEGQAIEWLPTISLKILRSPLLSVLVLMIDESSTKVNIMKVFLLDKFLLKINRIIGSFSDGLSLVSYDGLCWKGVFCCHQRSKNEALVEREIFWKMCSAL